VATLAQQLAAVAATRPGVTYMPPVRRAPARRRPVAPALPDPGDDLMARVEHYAASNPSPMGQGGDGGIKGAAVHGLGWLIGNPVSKTVLKPLEVLSYPLAGAVGIERQLLETDALEQANRALAKLPGIRYTPLARPDENQAGFDWGEVWRDFKRKQTFGTSIVEPQFGGEGYEGADQWNINVRRGLGLAGDIASDPLMKLGTGTRAAAGTENRISYLNKLLDAQNAAKAEALASREAADAASMWARVGGTGAEEAVNFSDEAAKRAEQYVNDLTKIGDKDAANLIGRRGVNIATPEQLRVMGAPQHAIRFAEVPIEDLLRGTLGRVAPRAGEALADRLGVGSEAASRAMSRFLSVPKGAFTGTAGAGLRRIRTPMGSIRQTLAPATERILTGEGPMTAEVALRTHKVNEIMRLAGADFKAPSLEYLNRFRDSLKGISKEDRAALVRVAEETGVENAVTGMGPQMLDVMKAMGLDPPELKPWMLPNGEMSRYVMPHVLSRDAFRFFNRLRKGQNPLLDYIRRDLGIQDKDLLEEGGHLQRRLFRPNADGSPQTFKIGEDEVSIATGSVAELEEKLGGLLRKHGFEGNLYESDPYEAWRRYITSVEKEVQRRVGEVEGAKLGLTNFRPKRAAPKAFDPFGREVRMQPAEGETEPRYVRGKSIEQRPELPAEYEWVEDVEATKARNKIITEGGKAAATTTETGEKVAARAPTHEQVLSEFRDVAPAERENLAREIEATRQYTTEAFDKARARSAKNVERAEKIVSQRRAIVDKLEQEYVELLKESSANEQIIGEAKSTIHGIRSQTPKNITKAQQARLAELAGQLEHERGIWESLQRALSNALQNDQQDQLDAALERFSTLHENLTNAEESLAKMRKRAITAVEGRIKRETRGMGPEGKGHHLVGPVEHRQAAEVVANPEAAARGQELLTRQARQTEARAAAEADAARYMELADRLQTRLDNLGQRPARSAAQQERLATSSAEMEAEIKSLRKQAAAKKSSANAYGMSARNTAERIKDDPWLQAKEVVDRYEYQQQLIEDYTAAHGLDMKAAGSRLNEARRQMTEYNLEQGEIARQNRSAATYQERQLARPDLQEHQQDIERLQAMDQELGDLGKLPELAGEKPPTTLEWHQPRGPGGQFVQGEYIASVVPEQFGRRFILRDTSIVPEEAATGEILSSFHYDPRGRGKPIIETIPETSARFHKTQPDLRGVTGFTGDNPPGALDRFRVHQDEQGWRLTLPGETEPVDQVFKTQFAAREQGKARWPALRRQQIKSGEEAELRRTYIESLREERDQLAAKVKGNEGKTTQLQRLWEGTPEERMTRARELLDSPEGIEYAADQSIKDTIQRELEGGAEVNRPPAEWQEVGRQQPARASRPLRNWSAKNARRRQIIGEMERIRAEATHTPVPEGEPFKLIKMPKKEAKKYIGNRQWWEGMYGEGRPDLSSTKRSRTIRLKKLQKELDEVDKWLGKHPQPPPRGFTPTAKRFRAKINGKLVRLERDVAGSGDRTATWTIKLADGTEHQFDGTMADAFREAERIGHGITPPEVDQFQQGILRQQMEGVERRMGGSMLGDQIREARKLVGVEDTRFGTREYPPIVPPTREEALRQPYERAIGRSERRLEQIGKRDIRVEGEQIRSELQGAADERVAGLQGEVASHEYQQQRIHGMIENLYQNRLPDPVRDWHQALDNAEQARVLHEQIDGYIKEFATRQRALSIVESNARKGAPTLEALKRVAKRELRPEDAQGLMAAVDDVNRWMTNAGHVLPAATRKRIEAALMSYEQSLAALTRENDLPAWQLDRIIKEANSGDLAPVLKAQLREAWREVGPDGSVIIDKELQRHLFGAEQVLDSKLFGPLFTTWTNFFKTYATLTPGFHVRNALSAIFMNATEGVGAREQMRALRLWREYKNSADPLEFLANLPTKQREAFRATFASGATGQFMEAGVGEARGGAAKMTERVFTNKATRLSKRLGGWVEGPQRLALGLHVTERGGSVAEALNTISRIHFDYGQVSKFDETMKRIIPFWTFMSRNVPLQFTQMWMKPKMYLAYQSFARNLMMGTEDNPVIPDYITQGGGMYFGAKTPKWASKIPVIGPPEGMPIVLQPDLPQQRYADDLSRLQGALSGGGLGQMATNLNPMLTVPAEFVSRSDFFTGQHFDPTDRVTVGGVAIPYALAMNIAGLAQRGSDGKWHVDAAAMNAMRGLDPNLDRLLRLMPQAAGIEGTDRQAESWGRWLGAPVRTISEAQQRSELRSRAFRERDRQKLAAELAGVGG
jgi:hypothetical protein